MNREEYLDFCKGISGAAVDQPFEQDFESWIVRHAESRKWFAAVLRHDGRDLVNLKCEPVEAEFLRSVYAGVTPAYHMNKMHWITVYLDSDVPDALLRELTINSRRLTSSGKKRAKTEGRKNGKPA